jgi:hypothetical protein
LRAARVVQEMGHLLAALLARSSESLPFPAELLRPGSAPPLMLRNWNLLMPVLSGHGVELEQDNKALVVAGGAQLPTLARSFAHARAAAHTLARAHAAPALAHTLNCVFFSFAWRRARAAGRAAG